MIQENRIKCGKCNSEYPPRPIHEGPWNGVLPPPMNYACPVCGHGLKAMHEAVKTDTKILLD